MLPVERTAYFSANVKLQKPWFGTLRLHDEDVSVLLLTDKYPNKIDDATIDYHLSSSKRDGKENADLVGEAKASPCRKRRFRFFEGKCAKTYDLGDAIAESMVGDRVVRFRRCTDSVALPWVGGNYKHASEEQAHKLLKSMFSDFKVLYEAVCLNVEGATYCVDFVVQAAPGAGPTAPVGIEVKSTLGAWNSDLDENVRKLTMYRAVMNTECFVIVMEPEAKAYRLVGKDLVSLDLREEVVRALAPRA